MPIRLDERLTRIATLVDYGRVADVGCDHGKLGYYLIGTDRASSVIATDISEGSLKKARELAYDNGVASLMQTRLGDGLVPVADGEVDTVVIAGLGGDVISGILAHAREDKKHFAHFVLSPNTHPEKVRRELLSWSHKIVYDDIVECGGKHYTVIKTQEGEESLDELQILFGAFYASSENFARLAKQELEYKSELLKKHWDKELESRVELLKAALANVRG
ncbi:MAG: SAM-dependent methyltransferase [Clostridiales bacterium]|nr:SAM-dependent methyltransferase [Clostridiales bacterium]